MCTCNVVHVHVSPWQAHLLVWRLAGSAENWRKSNKTFLLEKEFNYGMVSTKTCIKTRGAIYTLVCVVLGWIIAMH